LKIVYVAGRFNADTHWEVEQNVRRAEALAVEVARLGAHPGAGLGKGRRARRRSVKKRSGSTFHSFTICGRFRTGWIVEHQPTRRMSDAAAHSSSSG